MDPASLVYTLNLDAPETWNALTPVVLPTEPFTIGPLLPASMGVFVPFVLFVLSMLAFLYKVWHKNSFSASPSSQSFYMPMNITSRGMMMPGGGGRGGMTTMMQQAYRRPNGFASRASGGGGMMPNMTGPSGFFS